MLSNKNKITIFSFILFVISITLLWVYGNFGIVAGVFLFTWGNNLEK